MAGKFKVSIELEGYEKLFNVLSGDGIESLLDDIEREIENTQQLVFMESQIWVPVDTSLLKNSGRTHPVARDADGIEALISYNTHYALWVHERLEIRHKAPTQAKYLERPIREQEEPFIKALRGVLEQYFGGAR